MSTPMARGQRWCIACVCVCVGVGVGVGVGMGVRVYVCGYVCVGIVCVSVRSFTNYFSSAHMCVWCYVFLCICTHIHSMMEMNHLRISQSWNRPERTRAQAHERKYNWERNAGEVRWEREREREREMERNSSRVICASIHVRTPCTQRTKEKNNKQCTMNTPASIPRMSGSCIKNLIKWIHRCV